MALYFLSLAPIVVDITVRIIMATLFISDIHLEDSHPEIAALFLNFLKTIASQADALYILGDLFEVWVGDDDQTPFNLHIQTALYTLRQQGVPIFFLHGNRDFLIGETFAKASGCTLLSDPAVVDLYGKPTLLLHGDLLCTQDHAYLAFRQQAREAAYRLNFLQKPLAERKTIAAHLRMASQQHTQSATSVIMDATPQEIPRLITHYQVTQMIHGHTHRPAIHYLNLGQTLPHRHIVLSDWHTQGNALYYYPDHSCRLVFFN